MSGNAKRVHSILIGILVLSVFFSLAIIAYGWYYIFQLSSQMSKVKTEGIYLEKEIAALEDLNKKYKSISPYESLVFDSLPRDKQISSFVNTLTSVAHSNNLAISITTVGGSGAGTAAKTKTASDQTQMTKVSNYYQLKVTYTLDGSYSNFLNFLEQVKQMRRITNIVTINLNRPAEKLDIPGDKLNAEFASYIYVKP